MARRRMYEKGDRIDSFNELIEIVFDYGEYVWFRTRPVNPSVIINMTLSTIWVRFREGELFRAKRTEEGRTDVIE